MKPYDLKVGERTIAAVAVHKALLSGGATVVPACYMCLQILCFLWGSGVVYSVATDNDGVVLHLQPPGKVDYVVVDAVGVKYEGNPSGVYTECVIPKKPSERLILSGPAVKSQLTTLSVPMAKIDTRSFTIDPESTIRKLSDGGVYAVCFLPQRDAELLFYLKDGKCHHLDPAFRNDCVSLSPGKHVFSLRDLASKKAKPKSAGKPATQPGVENWWRFWGRD